VPVLVCELQCLVIASLILHRLAESTEAIEYYKDGHISSKYNSAVIPTVPPKTVDIVVSSKRVAASLGSGGGVLGAGVGTGIILAAGKVGLVAGLAAGPIGMVIGAGLGAGVGVLVVGAGYAFRYLKVRRTIKGWVPVHQESEISNIFEVPNQSPPSFSDEDVQKFISLLLHSPEFIRQIQNLLSNPHLVQGEITPFNTSSVSGMSDEEKVELMRKIAFLEEKNNQLEKSVRRLERLFSERLSV